MKEEKNPSCSQILGLAIFLIFGFIFIGVGLFLINRDNRTNRTITASQAWPVTTGEVWLTQVDESYDSEDISYIPRISYRYSVSGKEYSCDIQTKAYSYKKDANTAISSFPIGTRIQVAYNPVQPQDCVSMYDEKVFSLFPYIFTGMGISMVIFISWAFLKGKDVD